MKKNNRTLILLLVTSILAGLLCNFFYQNSPKRAIDISEFQEKLDTKRSIADKTLTEIQEKIIHSSKDSLTNLTFVDNDISYYVFQKQELVFWSDNNLDINNMRLPNSTNWQHILLPNAHCIGKLINFESYKFVALIKIKNNYSYENEELKNDFSNNFNINKEVLILNGKKTDKFAVFSSPENYLFSLAEPITPIYNETWSQLGLTAYSLAFILFFLTLARSPYLFRRRTLSLKAYIVLLTIVGLTTSLCLYFNFPSMLFLNKLFSPFQYASNPFLASISHLSIATGFIISGIYLFYFHTNTESINSSRIHIALLSIFSLYFILVYYVLSGLVNHSSIQLSILQINDYSFISVWIHFLILIWGVGMAMLFFKTHRWFVSKKQLKKVILIDFILFLFIFSFSTLFYRDAALRISISYLLICGLFYLPFLFPKLKSIYLYLAIWTFVYVGFVLFNSFLINNDKKMDKYKILAQNIFINGSTDNDRMADILLEELNNKIQNDKKIAKLVSNSDSLIFANNYLNACYFRGFWNKYEMKLNAVKTNSSIENEYNDYIYNVGSRLKSTNFFSVPANENNISYIGKFKVKSTKNDSITFFMEFYPRRNFRSYSFPNLLIASSPDIQTKLNIGIAKYEHHRLVHSSGKFDYSPDDNWIKKKSSDFFSTIYKGNIHYIYVANSSTYVVITEQKPYNSALYFLYFGYTFLAFFAIYCLLVWIYQLTHRKKNYFLGLTSKFQYAFIGLLLISFLGIFYVSFNFIQKKYKDEQVVDLENKKVYIQKALQDMYYWNQDLNALNTQALNFDLQDLSYIYHTDIHVYDNRGILIGSSQPLIFNKNLISNRISSRAYFKSNASLNQNEHIGKLNYLTGYTDFYNGDYLQIGYIAIPQFFSQDEIRGEIESFLAVIIHIYFIIIILAIMLSLLIGNQLAAPLNMLENKLKEMRLGRRNEKIDYDMNDEIGQLVIQYNRTVDELEKSARMLAKSEREMAWKSMARQVAHEINNPLTPMKLSIQQLQRTHKINNEGFDEYFEKSTVMLIEQIDNLSRIAGTFSNFARMPEANFERVDIASRLLSVVQLFINSNEQIQLHYIGFRSGIFVYADPEQLVQVFNNLLKNAIQSIPENRKGIINIQLSQEPSRVKIKIQDNGIGIEDQIHDKLFIPNFTTKTTGMGLGLAIAKNIIELSGGAISFETKVNEGTIFVVDLPLAE